MVNDPSANPYAIPETDDGLKLDALRYLQMIYRDPQLSTQVRMRAAGLAIPYESPKLMVTAVVNEQDFATLLDRRLERMKVIEHQPNNGKVAQPIETKPDNRLPPPIPDRRFRRV
jgi:hypothetical protein